MNDTLRALRVMSWACALVLSACGGSSAPPADARDGVPVPPIGGADDEKWTESWEGTTTGANPSTVLGLPAVTPCPVAEDPTCGHHRLVIPADVAQVMIAVRPNQESAIPEEETGASSNDYTLMVYNDRNELVAYSESPQGGAVESVVIENVGSAFFDVRVSPFLVAPGATFTGVALEVSEQPASDAAECLEAVPAELGLASVTDDGRPVELSVEVLLDGTDPAVAAQIMEKARQSYAPLNINLVLRSMRPVTIHSSNSTEIIAEAKVLSGGKPPAGVDIVAVLTNKTMQAATATGQGQVLGQADCIGGIRYPAHSFLALTDATADESFEIAGFYPVMDGAAEAMAHEIGHLMGAHHHYGNCVEGNLSSGGPNDLSPCTLMAPVVEGLSFNFGTLESLVVRGHAVAYADD